MKIKENFKKIKNSITKDLILLFGIIIFGTLIRVNFLEWDQGHFMHPDERLYVNASNLQFPKNFEEFLSPESPLNPNMFYYGSFPLYLYRILNEIFFKGGNILFTSRLLSAVFSILTIPIIYILGRKLFSKNAGIIAAIIFTFAPGGIQHAHFNTTESALVFFVSLITLLSLILYEKFSYKTLVAISILCAFSYATKITGLVFIVLPFLATIIQLKKLGIKKAIISIFLFLIIFIPVAFICAPYNLIDYQQFYKEQNYMQGVILGKDKPPFTIIYEPTLPFVFPFLQVMPFIFGFIAFPISVIGFVIICKILSKDFFKNYKYILIIVFPLIYFLWVGSWYAKFSRYFMLLLPFVSLWAAYFLSRINKKNTVLALVLVILNGLLFLRVYTKEHTRIEASRWIYTNIASGSTISGEHWDDNLPLPLSTNSNQQYNMLQLTVYDPDTSAKINSLSQNLSESDYFIISSRRVYQSIINNKKLYPKTSNFYDLMFNEKLGFKKEKEFTQYPFFINDDIADESFQSYDHPPVYIFKNVAHFDKGTIETLINGQY